MAKHEKIFQEGNTGGMSIAKTTLPMLFCKTRAMPYAMREELHVSWLRVDEGCRSSGALANRAGINIIIGVIRQQYSNWYRRTANSMW